MGTKLFAEALSNAEALLDEFLIADEFKALKKSSALVVTDKNGQLYLKKVLTTADNDDYVNAFFVKISSSVLEMSDEYREMIEENYKANKALDEKPETTTKNRLINDQNGELVAKFRPVVLRISHAVSVHVACRAAKFSADRDLTEQVELAA